MTSSGSLRTRDVTPDDLESAFDVRSRSFGPLDPSMRDGWNNIQLESIKGRRAIGVIAGERLLAHAKVRSYQQFWDGPAQNELLDAAFAGRPAYLLEYFSDSGCLTIWTSIPKYKSAPRFLAKPLSSLCAYRMIPRTGPPNGTSLAARSSDRQT